MVDTQGAAGYRGIRYATGRDSSPLNHIVNGMIFEIISPSGEYDSLTDREIAELDISEGARYLTAEGTESVLKGFAVRNQHNLRAVSSF